MKDVGHQLGECKEMREDGDMVWPESNGRTHWGRGWGRQSMSGLLSDQTEVHLKVAWIPPGRKGSADR